MRKQQEIKISNVQFYYVGDDKDFNLFLKTIIYDYLYSDKLMNETVQKENVPKV